MPASVIHLLRHAESAPSRDLAEPDWPLSSRGGDQAQMLIGELDELAIEIVVSSPYRRALDTVKPFADARGLSVHIDPRLRERKLTPGWDPDFMRWVQRGWQDLDFKLPGCESGRECQERVARAVGEWAKRCHRGALLVSSHGNAIGLYLRRGDPSFDFAAWQRMKTPECFSVDIDRASSAGD